MNKLTHDVLAVELSETHMRFAVVDTDRLTIDHFVQFGNEAFGTAAEALVAYIRSVPNPPRAIAIAITDGARLPSSGEIESQLTAADFGSGITPSTIRIVDALEALSSVLQDLAPHDVEHLAGDSPVDHAPKVAVCASDRVGVAAVREFNGALETFHTHAASISFAPQTQEELDIANLLRRENVHVSVEHVLSASRLSRLHDCLLHVRGQPVRSLSAAAVIDAAFADHDAVAVDTLNYFGTWLARFVADIALAYDARGGVYLWGPALRKIERILSNDVFRLAFETQAGAQPWLKQVPVILIRSEDAFLKGAAMALVRSTG